MLPVLARSAPRRPPLPADAGILPTDVTGLTGWWKADAGTYQDAGSTPATADGHGVAWWADQSGNSRTLRGSTTPTLKTGANGINGLPVIRFDGIDDSLTSNLAGWTLTNIITNTEFCCFMVVKAATPGTNAAASYDNDGIVVETSQSWGLHLKSTGPTFIGYNWDGSDDHADRTFTAGTVYALRWRHTGGNVSLLRSGTTEASAASGNTLTLTGSVRLGISGVANYFDGDVAEIFIYNAQPSAGQLTGLAEYITSRYGITW